MWLKKPHQGLAGLSRGRMVAEATTSWPCAHTGTLMSKGIDPILIAGATLAVVMMFTILAMT